eukprot:TRINITY_DN19234_c0_g1_i1.p1 TRINITY_DN19234_c0_g1~~TRINITY_DN19234_c0_g1_i1.p1  ORF type:complete len:608 (+),score=159.81 TRINITY_DN19234_c0_g1_i1:103-1926(+)
MGCGGSKSEQQQQRQGGGGAAPAPAPAGGGQVTRQGALQDEALPGEECPFKGDEDAEDPPGLSDAPSAATPAEAVQGILQRAAADFLQRAKVFEGKAFSPGPDMENREETERFIAEARELLGEAARLPESQRTKAVNDACTMLEMSYCAWVMAMHSVDIHNAREKLKQIAEGDDLFRQLAGVSRLPGKKSRPGTRKQARLAPRDEAQEDPEGSAAALQGHSTRPVAGAAAAVFKPDGRHCNWANSPRAGPWTCPMWADGPGLVDAVNASLGGKRFIDPDFPPSDASLTGGLENSATKSKTYAVKVTEAVSGGWRRPLPDAKLFQDGIELDDIQQGQVGNCWLISCLSAVGDWPQIVEQMFYPAERSRTGAYAVRIWSKGQWLWVVVDDCLPADSYGRAAFASSTDELEIWPMLLEKAFAKLHGGYAKMGGGSGHSLGYSAALTALSSGRCRLYNMSRFGGPARLSCSLLAVKGQSDRLVTASCGSSENGLVGNHAYTFCGLASIPGGQATLVHLRNTWGRKTWTGPWGNRDHQRWTTKLGDGTAAYQHIAVMREVDWGAVEAGKDIFDDGSFFMPVEDFYKHFRGITICDLPFDREYKCRLFAPSVK